MLMWQRMVICYISCRINSSGYYLDAMREKIYTVIENYGDIVEVMTFEERVKIKPNTRSLMGTTAQALIGVKVEPTPLYESDRPQSGSYQEERQREIQQQRWPPQLII
jgi:hypothetical protein